MFRVFCFHRKCEGSTHRVIEANKIRIFHQEYFVPKSFTKVHFEASYKICLPHLIKLLRMTGSCTKNMTIPEVVVTVLCTPYDGCGWHPKHVDSTCRIINRLLCVASRWSFSNTNVQSLPMTATNNEVCLK